MIFASAHTLFHRLGGKSTIAESVPQGLEGRKAEKVTRGYESGSASPSLVSPPYVVSS